MPNNNESSFNDLQAELAQLKAENEALKAKAVRKVGYKATEKGCLAMTGIRRFPLSFYKQEWEQIIGEVRSGRLEAALASNSALLSVGKSEEAA